MKVTLHTDEQRCNKKKRDAQPIGPRMNSHNAPPYSSYRVGGVFTQISLVGLLPGLR
jgi:hypothetical protein